MVSPTYVEGVIPCTRFAGLILHFARGDFCHFADFELEILRETSKYFVTSMSPFLLLEVCRRVSFWGSPFSFGVGGNASSSCKLTVKRFSSTSLSRSKLPVSVNHSIDGHDFLSGKSKHGDEVLDAAFCHPLTSSQPGSLSRRLRRGITKLVA